ncbi:MAG: hypothetical protein COV07_00715 [Candidatus Vogelbacteria bacterium CG10_big_fil_rev_8_21_14_0_10_45_14]|uniref:Segregation and condensation protein A n=1 Tax=Candidatus Vogelbacteria bacterium CG10_big_fil_rev_8_21_14_0_10_45_14 TaxID=1975042 RepID=A0A2H0RL38_9BACT|nr:MAG: hypothetical protein COV07_00715 [Candidatus Vogelbacteria bacterium CG10_big_fil_rev_8_21_14_0_10_45_14]
MNDKIFQVKQEAFSGPLDLLLSLIESRKLFVNEISLSIVADDFISYIEKVGGISTGEMANFVYTASTVLLVKARSLIPNIPLSEEETASISDLEERLRLLARVHEKMALLEKVAGKSSLLMGGSTVLREAIFAPPRTPFHLKEFAIAMQGMLSKVGAISKDTKSAVLKKMISLESVLNSIDRRIRDGVRLSWNSLAKDTSTKEGRAVAIVSFLALLELLKRGMVLASQSGTYRDIHFETNNVRTPHYGS